MTKRRYVEVPRPWRGVIDAGSDAAVAFFVGLVRQALEHRLPASRSWGRLVALAARRDMFPRRGVAAWLKVSRSVARPDLDALLAGAEARAGELHESIGLDPAPGRLSCLALARRAGTTVFVFGTGPAPVLVLKLPRPGSDHVDREMDALERARPARVAPRPLGRVGEYRAQEGLGGQPLKLQAVDPSSARSLRWLPEHAELAAGLARLGAVTAAGSAPNEVSDATLEEALRLAPLSARTRRVATAAVGDSGSVRTSVLRHVDTSAQNCLFDRGHLVGLVDWELARAGAPGFDALNAWIAYTEHGIGMTGWSDDLLSSSFEASWESSSFWLEGRRSFRATLDAAGIPPSLFDPLEVTLFVQRLALRMFRPAEFPTTWGTAARMLEIVARD